MNDLRMSSRDPVRQGPGALTLVVAFCFIAWVLRLFAIPTDDLPGALSIAALERGEWWTVFTHLFTHQDLWHLVSNMILLVLAGRAVEKSAGPRHFAYIFLTGAWAGAAMTLFLHPEARLAGASGGVWAVIGAFTALHPDANLLERMRRFTSLQLRAKRLFPAFLTVHLVFELAVTLAPDARWSGVSGVAHLAHAGGLLAGWIYGRRLSVIRPSVDTWNDLFPMGLRRRAREGRPVGAHSGGSPVFSPDGERSIAALPAPPPELTDSEFLREKVDPVLEKLHASGPGNLTDEERAILEEAARRFSRDQK